MSVTVVRSPTAVNVSLASGQGPTGATGAAGPNSISDATALGSLTDASADAMVLLGSNSAGALARKIVLGAVGRSLLGAVSAAAGRTLLGLGTLSVLSPSGTADATTFLRGDGSYQPLSGIVTTNASLLTSGTLADARLSANVPLLNAANVFTAGQSFNGTDAGNALSLLSLVNTSTTAGSGAAVDFRGWNATAGALSTFGRIVIRGDGGTNQHGRLEITLQGNGVISATPAVTLDVNGVFKAPTVTASTAVYAGDNSPTGVQYGGGSALRHGWWASDHLDMHGRAYNTDSLVLSYEGRFGIGFADRTGVLGRCHVKSLGVGEPVLVISGAASQTANVFQAQTSGGVPYSVIPAYNGTGTGNVFIGVNAGVSGATGSDIVAIGTGAGSMLSAGNGRGTFVGTNANPINSDDDLATAIGPGARAGAVAVAIGYGAFALSGGSTVAIGATATVNATRAMSFGAGTNNTAQSVLFSANGSPTTFLEGMFGWCSEVVDPSYVLQRWTSVNTNRPVGGMFGSWNVSTDATRQGQLSLGAYGIVAGTETLQTGLTVTADASGVGLVTFPGSSNDGTPLLKLGATSRGATVGYYDGAGAIQFGRSDHSSLLSVAVNATSVFFQTSPGVSLNLIGADSVPFLITAGEGGGAGQIQFGRRFSDSSMAVGIAAEFWSCTGQTTPVIAVMAPGGGSYRAKWMPDGSIVPASLADSSAANNSLYYSTTAGKLVYKDASGTVNNLY